MSSETPKRSCIALVAGGLVLLNLTLSIVWWRIRTAEHTAQKSWGSRFFVIHEARTGPIANELRKSNTTIEDELSAAHRKASRTITERYNRLVLQRRKLDAIVGQATTVADFPVHSGEEIVARSFDPEGNVYQSFGKPDSMVGSPVRMLFYLPKPLDTVICDIQTVWKTENGKIVDNDSATLTFTAKSGAVNEFVCRFRQSTAPARMNLNLAINAEVQTQEYVPCRVSSQFPQIIARRFFPNQRVTPSGNERSGAWKEALIAANTVFHHTFTLKRGNRVGEMSVVCRVAAEGTDSYCAMALAANNQSFIDRVLVYREQAFHFADELETIQSPVWGVLEKRDNPQLLYARIKINLHPNRSH